MKLYIGLNSYMTVNILTIYRLTLFIKKQMS